MGVARLQLCIHACRACPRRCDIQQGTEKLYGYGLSQLGFVSHIGIMRISFIIPAYNASGTIVRCLDSIYVLPIDESDYEVIVIDDCSTDNTVEIVKQFAVKHSNLVLLQQVENHRQGTARNR